MMDYDYIVVGAGSAGCAVAARLSEHLGHRVLLLEAGGPDDDPNIHIPAMFPSLFKTAVDWAYETEPQKHLNHRRDYMPRGKVLGGSSSMNAMVYQRGHATDYDRWAQLGNDGWSWREVLPYFKRAEDQERGESDDHGVGGPLNVADLRDPNPLALTFVQACEQQGLPLTTDFNDGAQAGFGMFQVTQKGGWRCSTAVGYLGMARNCENLSILTDAQVLRLTFDGKRCTGAIYQHDREEHHVVATREVILCGGAINSPQLLLLSGIGPRQQLELLGIDVLVDLPGVGQNLQDHLLVPVAYHCTQPISIALAASDTEMRKFQESQRGLLTSSFSEAGGFIRLDPNAPAPELQLHFGTGWFVNHGFANPEGHGFTVLPTLVSPQSVGSLMLQSSDPYAPPRIDPNFLAAEADLEVLVQGVKLARKIVTAAAFDLYRGDEYLPGAVVQSDQAIATFIRDHVHTIYHPVGTCKMGNDPLAVVNHQLQVQGVQQLRVADASIMPNIINANTNAACIMIGEKCADMVSKTA